MQLRSRRTRAGVALAFGFALVATLVAPAYADPATTPEDPDTEQSEQSEQRGRDEHASQDDDSQDPGADEGSADPETREDTPAQEDPEEPVRALSDDGARIVVNELTNGGPGGFHDNFIELANLGSEPQDVSGWEVYRCTAGGTEAATPQLTLDGTIEPGGLLVLGRSAGGDNTDQPHPQLTVEADLLYHTSLHQSSYGAIIRDTEGELVDAVGVKDPSVAGAACVTGTPLPNTTDSALGESWQRIADTGDNLNDFIKAPSTPGEENTTDSSPPPLGGDVLISEVAHAGEEGEADHLVEIGNYGEQSVSLDGWGLWRCDADGRRYADAVLADDLPDTIASGEALVIETGGFDDGGAGVVLADADGAVVDRVAWVDGKDSACAEGQPLPYFVLDVADGESYQRIATEGANREAFVAAPRGPGQLEANEPEDGNGEEEEEFLSTTGGPNIRVAEMTNTGPGGTGDIFFEVINYGDEVQDLTGWSIWRCVGTGVRASVPNISEAQLEGVVLEPGERITAARSALAGPEIMAVADLYFDISFAEQYGLIIFDDAARVVDRVGSSIAGVENYCAQDYGRLPGTLSGIHAETWQRVDLTGDASTDWQIAPRTPGAVNDRDEYERPAVETPVRVTEVANGGPEGPADNFIELTNLGEEPVNIGGWEFFRCTGTGRTDEAAHQLTFPDATLAPGESFVAGREGGFSGEPDAWYGTSFAIDGGFGVMITDGDRRVVDSVGVFSQVDSACTQGQPLPNDLDFVGGESWQRMDDTGDNSADFARGARTPGEHGGDIVSVVPEILEPGNVQIVEMANGGAADYAGAGSDQFLELGNRGDEPVDVSGYQIYYCTSDGRRDPLVQAELPEGTELAPGQAWTLASADASAGLPHDAVSAGSMDPEGYGIIVMNADGAIVDRVSVFYDYAGFVTNAPPSLCSSGVSLDRRMTAENLEAGWRHDVSYHRWQYTGDNYHDYVVRDRDPGEFVQVEYHDPTVPEEGALDPADVERYAVPEAPETVTSAPTGDDGAVAQEVIARAASDGTLAVRGGTEAEHQVRAFTGVAPHAPLVERVGADEAEVEATEVESAEYGRDYPYVRLEIEVGEIEGPAEVIWTGTSSYRNELQMYLWDGEAWELADARSAEDGGEITLIAEAGPGYHRGGVVDVLVQDGPRTGVGLVDEVNQSFQDPGTYDFSLGHLTDTQYVVDQAPWVYTELNAWFAANHEARDLAFVMHTGDIIENALRGNQLPDRAIEEFERASAIQEILEDAGVPHAILPGNHDNWWGNNNDLYLEYFPEERYEHFDWWGGAGPRGATAHYSLIERDGVKMLFLSMPYYSAQSELDWASDVIEAHPEHNVILGTHEYLRPHPQVDERANPGNGRWAAQGDVFFEHLVEPHENVALIMSGHLHGVRQRVLEDVGGTPGRQVVEMVADYQSYHEDEIRIALFNRLMQIDVAAGEMAINAYSPGLDSFEPWRYEHRLPDPDNPDNVDPDFEFTAEHDELVLPIDLMSERKVSTGTLSVLTGVEEIGDGAEVAAGEELAVTWDELVQDEVYGWYAQLTSSDMGREDLERPSAVAVFTASAEGTDPEEPGDRSPEDLVEDLEGRIEVPETVTRGAEETVGIGATAAGVEVEGYLFSDPVVLGTATVASDGTAVFTIPVDAPLGEHRFAVYETDGELIGWAITTVIDPADQPGPPDPDAPGQPGAPGADPGTSEDLGRTGAEVAGLIVAAVLLLIAGALVIGQSRRRSNPGAVGSLTETG